MRKGRFYRVNEITQEVYFQIQGFHLFPEKLKIARMDLRYTTKYMLADQPKKTSAASSSPTKIGPYKVKKMLGKGGMSELYLGAQNGQDIVIKVLSPKFASNQEIFSRFRKEAEIIAMADHPNVVRLLGQGAWEKGLYIAMEFIPGVSLREFLQKKNLPHEKAIEILLQVSYALCHLHTHGVIHRDLKPENILIMKNGHIKVIDFGIAEIEAKRSMEGHASLIGTPIYMSPEQKKNPNLASYASDIYSLGILAYELFIKDAIQGKIELERVPVKLKPMLEKALEPDPAKRFPDIVDWISALKAYANEWKKQEAKQNSHTWVQKNGFRHLPIQVECAATLEDKSYCECFELTAQKMALVFAQPADAKETTLNPLLVGMIKMAIEIEASSLHPISLVDKLRKVVAKETKITPFYLAICILDLEKKQFSYLSCGNLSLWKHVGKNKELYTTPNPPLAGPRSPASNLLSTAGAFHDGNELILHDPAHTPLLKITSL